MILLLLPTLAWSAGRHGYLGLHAGSLNATGIEGDQANPVIFSLGQRLSARFAFQLEYSVAESFKSQVSKQGKTETCLVDYSTQAAYLVLIQSASSWIDYSAKLGYLKADYNFKNADISNQAKEAFNSTNLSYGLGLVLKLNNRIGLIGEYTQLRSDAYHLSAGVELSF
ncbi:Outer membrane protein beta-barrel domain-containing protein [Oceanospirillum multiglobuliferum]|uniref:Outer membrane protein beta-barrel domain-containing protein n=1 Tax=Oceanospirillum multiglobuliferum TaxID=64969 RepID=A0A1T4NLJ8_9GAMM|nr:outer membrane beta-barrel protein [Oceanospirillum multiglobuliferum]OPX55760.1 hypothetical protein BTE48_07680 [Oceanospirillum multiglobuliferum]SJZ80074.1 Outer membrane protein beta-barrel domain-containing protein [Oceanospirillum multiglobuliferum]